MKDDYDEVKKMADELFAMPWDHCDDCMEHEVHRLRAENTELLRRLERLCAGAGALSDSQWDKFIREMCKVEE